MPIDRYERSSRRVPAPTRSFGALAMLFEELNPKDRESLRKTLQIFLDPKSALQSDNEKRKKLETILKS